MKKFLTVAFAVVISSSLLMACGSKNEEGNNSDIEVVTEATEDVQEETEAVAEEESVDENAGAEDTTEEVVIEITQAQ